MSETLAVCGGQPAVTFPYPAYPCIDAEEVCAATRVLLSGVVSECGRGPSTTEMEDAHAAFYGATYCLGGASGTGAIHSALFAVGVHPGSEVLCANHNWISGIMAVFHAGAVPVLCDIKAGSFSIDPEEIRRKATPRTKAIVVTHLWGIPADMDNILAVARELSLPVIEDVSHAHGGRYKGRYLGTLGDIGCFSLQGSKAQVGGEGGYLITDNERYYQRAMVPGQHGARLGREMLLGEMQPFATGGGMWTYRMAPIAAAIATAQLRKLPHMNASRQANFDRLREAIADLPFITWPTLDEGSQRGWYGTPGFFDEEQAGISRAAFVQACQAEGVQIGGEGYTDWSQIASLQNPELLGQLVVTEHVNGTRYTPVPAGSFPNHEAIRRTMLLFGIPAAESPVLIDQVAAAVHKVAANVDLLKETVAVS